MFELPLTDGASSVIWSDESCGIGERLRIECKAGDSWLVHSETHERHDDEWGEGGVGLEGYRSMMHDLLILLGSRANPTTLALLEIMAKGRAEVPLRKSIKLASASGWWVRWTCDGGKMGTGEPIISIEFKVALSAERMVFALTKMAAAFDAWDGERS